MDDYIPIPNISARQYAFGTREATIKDFDEKNKDQIETTLEMLNKILAIKLMVVETGGVDFAPGPLFDAFALSKSALDVVVSALHMVRQRAAVESLLLLRVAMEAGSTALHISSNTDAYKQYKMDKYKSTSAISCAKTAIPLLGEIWGALSNSAVHITRRGFGPKFKQDADGNLNLTVSLEYNIRKQQSNQDQLLLGFILLVATIVLKLTEMTLFKKSTLRSGWLRLNGTKMEYFNNTDAQICEYYKNIQTLRATHFREEQ